jgi:penicillin G amidase
LPPADARRSIQVLVLDAQGHYTRAGAEVRVYDAASSRLLGLRLVDTGSGYNSQNAMPVHIGLAEATRVHVRITTMSPHGPGVWDYMDIDLAVLAGKPFQARVGGFLHTPIYNEQTGE